MSIVRRGMIGITALGIVAGGALASASPASALASTGVSGTVNCNGSTTVYSTIRKMTGYSNVQLYVKQAAYSDGHWPNGPYTAMGFLVKITKTGATYSGAVSGADRWATFATSGYMPGTTFVLGASMTASSGTCHNSWAGTLSY